MSPGAGKLALVPLLAVAAALGATGIHGRRTHDPARAQRAMEILAPTDDVNVARAELESFFETGWVGWDVKTAVEISCGSHRARTIGDPVGCAAYARIITYDHQSRERGIYRTYTWLAWASLVPLLLAVALAASTLAGAARRRRRAA